MKFLSSLVKWGHTRGYNAGILHYNKGEFARAAECFEGVLREVRDPNDPDHCLALVHAAEARANLGLAFFHAGDYARAEAEFTRALEENPTFPDLRYYRARIFERSGRIDEAIEDLERALAEHPHYLEGHLLLAVCLGLKGDREHSSAQLGEALSLGLEAPEWVTPAVARDWTGEQWRRLLPDVAARTNGAGAKPLDRALAHQQAGDLAGAIAELTRAVTEKPSYADLRCRLGGLLLEDGRLEDALDQFKVALELNPRYLEARLLAARAELERGRAAAAGVEIYVALVALEIYPFLLFWLAVSLFLQWDRASARATSPRPSRRSRPPSN